MKPNEEIMAQAQQYIEHYQEVLSDVLSTVEAQFGEDAASLLVVYSSVLNRQLQFMSLLQSLGAPKVKELVEDIQQDAVALAATLSYASLSRIPKKGDPDTPLTAQHLELSKFYRVISDKMVGLELALKSISKE